MASTGRDAALLEDRVDELLQSARGCPVRLASLFSKHKLRAKERCDVSRLTSRDRQAAASFWTIVRKSANDGEPACGQRRPSLPHIGGRVFLFRQEVKDGTIVPNIEGFFAKRNGRDVGDDPADLAGAIRQSSPGDSQRLF